MYLLPMIKSVDNTDTFYVVQKYSYRELVIRLWKFTFFIEGINKCQKILLNKISHNYFYLLQSCEINMFFFWSAASSKLIFHFLQGWVIVNSFLPCDTALIGFPTTVYSCFHSNYFILNNLNIRQSSQFGFFLSKRSWQEFELNESSLNLALS